MANKRQRASLRAAIDSGHGVIGLVARKTTIVSRGLVGLIRGLPGVNLPHRSRIVQPSRITVGADFFATGPVWIEAVTGGGPGSREPLVTIGRNLQIATGLHIAAVQKVQIGDDCLFGSGVLITDHSHGRYSGENPDSPIIPPAVRTLHSSGAVVIGDRVWLGDGVVVLPGVTIGDGVVIGANSVVTKDIPGDVIAAGNPAKIIRRYEPTQGVWQREKEG
ncbi:DapH/DapD/GlmU-related protein [Mycetocola zhujimingii]|uniref:DapH/DapD/GlmU-related protein n=1 Tax=Mycetocola zhujimingii TaxID=2079792 RepID=UPI001304DE60|nr:DapH/DapD/GlmU-related protein [Mycetocola zhujimingii]